MERLFGKNVWFLVVLGVIPGFIQARRLTVHNRTPFTVDVKPSISFPCDATMHLLQGHSEEIELGNCTIYQISASSQVGQARSHPQQPSADAFKGIDPVVIDIVYDGDPKIFRVELRK